MMYRLNAYELKERFGFADGDLFAAWDGEVTMLDEVVKALLMPKLDPRVTFHHIMTHHNSCRASEETWQFIDDTVFVEVLTEQLIEMGYTLRYPGSEDDL